MSTNDPAKPPIAAPDWNIDDSEWQKAKKYFAKNPNRTKFVKKETETKARSFIKIAGDIYALNNTGNEELDAGKGGFGRVKHAINQKGKRIVIKVESKELKSSEDKRKVEAVDKLMKAAGYLLGRKEQQLDSVGKIKASSEISGVKVKVYTAYQYRGDRNLEEEIKINPDAKTPPNNLILALKALEEVKALHKVGIVHGDIKLNNFMVDGKGESLTVKLIDFDESCIAGSDFTKTIVEDTRMLGSVLSELGLPKELYEPLNNIVREKRITIDEAIKAVRKAIDTENKTQSKEASQDTENKTQSKVASQKQAKTKKKVNDKGKLKLNKGLIAALKAAKFAAYKIKSLTAKVETPKPVVQQANNVAPAAPGSPTAVTGSPPRASRPLPAPPRADAKTNIATPVQSNAPGSRTAATENAKGTTSTRTNATAISGSAPPSRPAPPAPNYPKSGVDKSSSHAHEKWSPLFESKNNNGHQKPPTPYLPKTQNKSQKNQEKPDSTTKVVSQKYRA